MPLRQACTPGSEGHAAGVLPAGDTSRSPTRPPESAEKLVASALLVTLLVIALKTTKVPVNPKGDPLRRRKTMVAAERAAVSAQRWPSGQHLPALRSSAQGSLCPRA